MDEQAFSRRSLLKGGLAAGAGYVAMVTGADAALADEKKAPNLFDDILSGFEFIGQDGNKVDLAELKKSLKDKYTTLTFGLSGCVVYCPPINTNLGVIGEMKPDIVSIVVGVDPVNDGMSQKTRDNYLKEIRDPHKEGKDVVKQKVIVLYPAKPDKDGKLQPADGIVTYIEEKAGAIVRHNKPASHTDEIYLFEPGGKKIAEKSGLRPESEFRKEWSGLLSAKGRGK